MRSDTFIFMRASPVDLMRYLPKFLARDKVFKNQQDTLSREHENYRLKLIDTAKQFFVESATWGIKDWENFLSIMPAKDSELELRRTKVMAKLLGASPMTVENTNKLINLFTDDGKAYVEELAEGNTLKIILPSEKVFIEEIINLQDGGENLTAARCARFDGNLLYCGYFEYSADGAKKFDGKLNFNEVYKISANGISKFNDAGDWSDFVAYEKISEKAKAIRFKAKVEVDRAGISTAVLNSVKIRHWQDDKTAAIEGRSVLITKPIILENEVSRAHAIIKHPKIDDTEFKMSIIFGNANTFAEMKRTSIHEKNGEVEEDFEFSAVTIGLIKKKQTRFWLRLKTEAMRMTKEFLGAALIAAAILKKDFEEIATENDISEIMAAYDWDD